jgi:ABC-type nitrate/sulfonate/bicarbonate transport system ATPase subunit
MGSAAAARPAHRGVAAVTAALAVEIARKSFAGPDGAPRLVLRDVAFTMAAGEFVALVGPSGCGKTTLLNLVAGLDRDVAGSVRIGDAPPEEARIGYVFQQPRLLPWRTVFENVALVLPKPAPPGAILRLLDEVGLAEARDVYPSRLSLGMARRVAIARALAIAPALLLMDEPFTSLDEATADRLRRLLIELWRARRMTVLLVTHDAREAIELADRILLLSDAPGHLIGDLPIPLTRDRRADRAAIEAVRTAIAARRHALVQGDGKNLPPPPAGEGRGGGTMTTVPSRTIVTPSAGSSRR